MANAIFDAGVFEKVHLVWYNHLISPTVHTSKHTYLQQVRNKQPAGATNFNNCFNYVTEEMKKMDNFTNVQIIFLTDGDGDCDGQV